ncbi:hypothetical protein [Mesorhizobium caraganae]|uniref:hypothetical protein n=1 Tax=Mesorhizobium caraganae TaxID=483206 RepID=UPI003EBD82B5
MNAVGLSDFDDLRKAITRHLYFVAFDLLHLNGHDERDMTAGGAPRDPGKNDPGRHPYPVQLGAARRGKATYNLGDQVGLEGMVSKWRDSKYRSGLSTNRLKAKNAWIKPRHNAMLGR